MNMNRERYDKGIDDHFRGVTKMILEFKPIEFDGFRVAEGVEIDSFENEHQNEMDRPTMTAIAN
jgi:hypothetical protein